MVFKRSATYLIVTGVLSMIFGIVAMIYPIGTVGTLVTLWGIYALTDGVLALVTAFGKDAGNARGLFLVTGVMGVIAGCVAIFRPFSSAVVLTVVLGIWLLLRGLIEIASAFTGEVAGSRWGIALGGVLWLIAGVFLLANPGVGAVAIALWVGILAVSWGAVLLAMGLRVRSQTAQPA